MAIRTISSVGQVRNIEIDTTNSVGTTTLVDVGQHTRAWLRVPTGYTGGVIQIYTLAGVNAEPVPWGAIDGTPTSFAAPATLPALLPISDVLPQGFLKITTASGDDTLGLTLASPPIQ